MPIQFPPDPNKYPPILQDETQHAADLATLADVAARHAAQETRTAGIGSTAWQYSLDATIHAYRAKEAATYAASVTSRPDLWIDAAETAAPPLAEAAHHAGRAQTLARLAKMAMTAKQPDPADPLDQLILTAGQIADAAHAAARQHAGPVSWPSGDETAQAKAAAAQYTMMAAKAAQNAYSAAHDARRLGIQAAAAVEHAATA